MKPPHPIRLLIVDDHFFVRAGLANSLADEPDLLLAGEAGSVAEAVRAYDELRPDVILLDLRLPDGTGAEALAEIRARHPDARAVVFSVDETEEDIWSAHEAGALAYLPKSASRQELLAAVRAAAAGREYFPPAIAARLRERRARTALSARELDVLRLVVAGESNKLIADQLGIAQNTVKIHVTHLMAKLGAPDRTSAAKLAVQRGLVRIG